MFNFEFSRINLEFQALNQFETPYFLGSTFRGILGKKLKKTVCIKPFLTSCIECEFKNTCPYTTIFETEIILNKPSKYVVKPEFKRRNLDENETLNLEITLLGDTANYWEFIISSYNSILNLGKERYIKLKNVYFYHPKEEKYHKVKSFIPKFEAKDLLNKSTNKNKIKIKLYPTSLKRNGKIVKFNEFDKEIFIKSILSRISIVSQNYGEKKEKLFINKDNFNIIDQKLKPSPLKRWSNRKKRHMTIPAFEGELILEGKLNEIYPYLKIIENINIGKSVSFGLGNVNIMSEFD